MDGGGAGGIGRGPLTSGTTGKTGTTGTAGSAMGVGMTTSGKGCVTVTPERWLAMRGSLRVIVTDETGGVTTGAGAACGMCILAPTSSMGIWESETGASVPVWRGYVPSEEDSREDRGSGLLFTGSGFLGMDILGFLEAGSSSADF